MASDAPASRSPGTPRVDDDSWIYEESRFLDSLPHELQQLPHCRHSFFEHLCVDIATALQHQVHEDGSVVWTAAPQRRLAALNVLAQLPIETALSSSIAYAVLRSCLDAEADVAAAALRCRRLSVAIEVIQEAEAMKWFEKLIHALENAKTDSKRGDIASAIPDLVQSESGCAAFVSVETSARVCGVLLDAVRVAETEDTRISILMAIGYISKIEEGRTGLIAAGACAALAHDLSVAKTELTIKNVAKVVGHLAAFDDGRTSLVAAGACGVLVDALRVAETENIRYWITWAIGYLCKIAEGRAALLAAGALGALVDALRIAETNRTRANVAWALCYFSNMEEGRAAFIAAGACGALVDALRIVGNVLVGGVNVVV